MANASGSPDSAAMAQLPADVVALMNRQHGVSTTAQLVALGFPERRIATAVRRGRLQRLHRGALVLPAVWDEAAARTRHCLRLLAVQLAVSAAVGWGPTAAVVRMLPVLSLPQLPVVARPPSSGRRIAGATVRRLQLPADDHEVVWGLSVTSLPRTVIDVVESFGFRGGLMTVDAALRRGVRVDDLRQVAERRPDRRRDLLLRAIESGDPCAESALESLSRSGMIAGGLPPPLCNVVLIRGGWIYRVDFLWLELGLVGESDGRGKYEGRNGSSERSRGSDTADALMREKRRHERIEEWTLRVVRWGYPEAAGDGEPMLRRLRQAMKAQGALGFVWPSDVRAEIRTPRGVVLPAHVTAEIRRLQRLGYPISVNDRAPTGERTVDPRFPSSR